MDAERRCEMGCRLGPSRAEGVYIRVRACVALRRLDPGTDVKVTDLQGGRGTMEGLR